MAAAKKNLLISVDVEAIGPNPDQLIQLGCAFCLEDEESSPDKWGTFLVSFKFDEHDAEPATWSEFWTNPNRSDAKEIKRSLDFIREHGVDKRSGGLAFCKWYDELATKYGNITFICDPSGYDWGFVKHLYFSSMTPETILGDKFSDATAERKEAVKKTAAERIRKFPFSARCLSSMQKAAKMLCEGDKARRAQLDAALAVDPKILPHSHMANEDAAEQLMGYLLLRKWLKDANQKLSAASEMSPKLATKIA